MADTLWGDVLRVIDGDTFDAKITHQHKDNKYKYNAKERIRINAIDAPELPSPPGYDAKQRLQNRIGGKHVRLVVHGRDNFSRLVCDVSLADK